MEISAGIRICEPSIMLMPFMGSAFDLEYSSSIEPKEGETIKIGKIEFTVEKTENSKILTLVADISALIFG